VLLTLVILHVLAALKHLLIDRDGIFTRMLPQRFASRRSRHATP
jgi:cytochrome b561